MKMYYNTFFYKITIKSSETLVKRNPYQKPRTRGNNLQLTCYEHRAAGDKLWW